MNQSPLKQYANLSSFLISGDLRDWEKLLAPILFSLTSILLLNFALGTNLETEKALGIYISQSFIVLFLGLQLFQARSFETELHDKFFDRLRTMGLNPYTWFLAKYTQSFIGGAIVLAVSMGISTLFNNHPEVQWSNFMFGVGLLTLAGLASLGVLLSAIVMHSSARQILYPILYFPLSTPVLLSAVESCRAYLIDGQSLESVGRSWIGLLIIFIVIYCTLGMVMFAELLGDE